MEVKAIIYGINNYYISAFDSPAPHNKRLVQTAVEEIIPFQEVLSVRGLREDILSPQPSGCPVPDVPFSICSPFAKTPKQMASQWEGKPHTVYVSVSRSKMPHRDRGLKSRGMNTEGCAVGFVCLMTQVTPKMPYIIYCYLFECN